MVGIVIVTHGKIGEEMVRATLSIVKEPAPLVGVSIEHSEEVESMRLKNQNTIWQVDRGQVFLLLA